MLQRVLRPDDFNVRAGAHDHHYHDDDHHHHYAGAHDHHYHHRAPIYLLKSATCM